MYLAKLFTDRERIKGLYYQQTWQMLNLEIFRWLRGNVIFAFKLSKDTGSNSSCLTVGGRLSTHGWKETRGQPETMKRIPTAKETEWQNKPLTKVVGSRSLRGFQQVVTLHPGGNRC